MSRLTERMPTLAAGLGPGGVGTLYRLGLISAGKALALVLTAQSVATGVVSVIAGTGAWQGALAWGLVAAAGRAMLTWGGQVAGARAAFGAKETLRAKLAQRLLAGGFAPVGSSTVLATHGLDELDEYYGTVLPAITNAAVIPLLVGARILAADWLSAVIIVVTVPLIPVFMALVGMHTRDSVADASRALARLSDHLVELARGLPVLVGLGRIDDQTAALERVTDEYRTTTMVTLRTAFLSSLVLELLSTISVAVVAVFVGLRLVNGSLPLEVGLLALILAPECFAPFRELGAAFHASQNGVAALGSAEEIIGSATPTPLDDHGSAGIELHNLTVTYADRQIPAVANFSAQIERREITALTGASGSGKSTVLSVLAGLIANGADGASVTGTRGGVDSRRIAWVGQHPVFASESVHDELHLYGDGIPKELLDDRIAELCTRLGLLHTLADDPTQLSPGELRRVALVRALLRVDAGADLLILDEPTAHLDHTNSHAVRAELERLRGRVTIVLASHDADVVALASRCIAVGHQSSQTARENTRDVAPAIPDARSVPTEQPVIPAPGFRASIGLLASFVAASRGRFAAALSLGLGASLFGVSLTAVSGWLIVRASEHPAIMYLMVAIVGVRFFGIGRSVLHYGERIATHDAILRSTDRLRLRVWHAIASLGASSRKLLRGGTTIDYLVITADRIRDLTPRVVLPVAVGVLTALAAVIATAFLHAPAVPLLAGSLFACLVFAPAIAVLTDRRATASHAALGSLLGRRFASVVAAAADLQANGVAESARLELAKLDAAAAVKGRLGVRALGAGQSLVVFVCCATAVLILPVCLPAVTAGTLPGEVVAVLVLLPLALVEPLLGVVSAVQLWPTLAAALGAVSDVTVQALHTGDEPDDRVSEGLPPTVDRLEVDGLAARWPGAAHPAFANLTASVERGDWLVVEGPSGSGKSTLLTLLLGYLRPDSGSYRLGERDTASVAAPELRRHLAWAPQEGHLFDSTIRANLLLARGREDAPVDAELDEVITRVGLGPLLDSLPAGLDTRIGSQGSRLSGGQRQRLAVARTLLTQADILLLDEPTAHLDDESASALIADLRGATRDQLTVLVTHRAADIRADDAILRLGSAASGFAGDTSVDTLRDDRTPHAGRLFASAPGATAA